MVNLKLRQLPNVDGYIYIIAYTNIFTEIGINKTFHAQYRQKNYIEELITAYYRYQNNIIL